MTVYIPGPDRAWDFLNQNTIRFWPGRHGPRPAPDPRSTRARPAPDPRLGPRLDLRLDLRPEPPAWRLHPPHSDRLWLGPWAPSVVGFGTLVAGSLSRANQACRGNPIGPRRFMARCPTDVLPWSSSVILNRSCHRKGLPTKLAMATQNIFTDSSHGKLSDGRLAME